MNIIIAGASGFVGAEVVRQAIASPKIRHIFIVTRSQIPENIKSNEKVTVIMHNHFVVFPVPLVARMVAAKACIWTVGGFASQFNDAQTARMVTMNYTFNAAKTFFETLAVQQPFNPIDPQPPDPPFRFVYLSCALAKWDDPSKPVMYTRRTSRFKGEAERRLCQIQEAYPDRFEVRIARPVRITKATGNRWKYKLLRLMGIIPVDHLARSLLRLTTDNFDAQFFEAGVLSNLGKHEDIMNFQQQ